ncbi:MAG: GNAT family N-acetyltransferase [Actinomycetota bacterium]|nr:GNAT family N-acetyltransferase [Actinomycetota bacterium]
MAEDVELPFPQYRCPSCERDLPLNEARMTVTCASHQPEDDLAFVVREAKSVDLHAIEEICDRALGETEVDVFGRTFDVARGVNMIAEAHDELSGLLSLAVDRGELVIVLLSVYPEYQGKGVGGALLRAAYGYCRDHGLPFIRVAVSNDDIPLLYFYQRHGFVIDDITVGLLVDTAGASVAGFSGIPSRDEIRLRRPICDD